MASSREKNQSRQRQWDRPHLGCTYLIMPTSRTTRRPLDAFSGTAVCRTTRHVGRSVTDGNRPTEKPKAGTVSAKQLDSAVLYKFLGSTSSLRQLEMMLDRQRMLWFESPGGFGEANITDPELGKRLGWIYRILDARVGAKVVDNLPVAVGIHQEAWAAYTNYIDGRDYFGRRKNFVPTFALKTYLDQLEKSSAALKKIESNAASLYQAAEQNQSIVAGGKLAIQDAAETRTYLANRINRIKDEDIKGNILPRLNSANKACEDLQKELDPKLARLEAQVKDSFGLQPKAFLNALSTMAFQITDSHGGPVQAFAQAGNLVLEASANILDNSGNLIEKRYVVGAIKSLEGSNLKDDLQALSSGFINPASSYSLLVRLDKLRGLCESFSENPQVKANFETTLLLNKYIDAIEHRNSVVSEYNAELRQLLDLDGAFKRIEAEMQTIGLSLQRSSDPGVAAAVTYVRGIHLRARTECLRQIAMATRAKRFFLLEEQLKWPLNGNPGQLTSTDVTAANSDLQKDVYTELEAARPVPSPFPKEEKAFRKPDQTKVYSPGVLIVLTPKTHPDLFEDLLIFNSFKFVIDLATTIYPGHLRDELAYCADSSRSWVEQNADNPRKQNPFSGMANVRLTKVKIFAEGIETGNNSATIFLTHVGNERLCTASHRVFPASGEVGHNRVEVKFSYATNYYKLVDGSFAAEATDLHSGAYFGDLQATYSDIKHSYAAIGPFGIWQLTIPEEENANLKLDNITRLLIDFHGTCLGVNRT